MGTNLKKRRQDSIRPRKPATKRAVVTIHSRSEAPQDDAKRYLSLRQNAFLAVWEAKKRGDQSFLGEIAAYAKSKQELPADFLPGRGKGRKPSRNREIIELLGRVTIKPDGRIHDLKSSLENPKVVRQAHVEILRFCRNLVRDLKSEHDQWRVAKRYGFYRKGEADAFQKAQLIGMCYDKSPIRRPGSVSV